MLTISSPHIFDRSNTHSPILDRPRSAACSSARDMVIPGEKDQRAPVTVPEPADCTDEDVAALGLAPSSGLLTLINKLRALLGTKGLASEDIDIEEVQRIMEEYTSDEADWKHLALHDPTRNYSRNGILNINGNANLLMLAWTPGKSSAIHDHANAHCCMKILDGELTESLYDIPTSEGQLVPKKNTVLHRDVVGYISDDIGLHKISNSGTKQAVSLHLYTPPYASMYGCSMYESGNGKKHHVDMSKYYSWQGQLVNPRGGSTC